MAYREIEDAPAKFKSSVAIFRGLKRSSLMELSQLIRLKLSASCVRVIYPT